MYYHISDIPNLTILKPFIPSCAVPSFENITVARVCLSTFIDGCLMGLEPFDGAGIPFYVYETVTDFKPIIPGVERVRDSKYTKEIWSLTPIKVKCIGIIDVLSIKKKVNRNSGRGRVVEKWYNWVWIEKYI